MAPSFVVLVAFVLGPASTVLTAATPPRIGTPQGSSFSITQIRNARHVRHGPSALAKAYHKYGIPLPEDLAAAVANVSYIPVKRATGTVTAIPAEYDVEYLSPVQIGTPPQTLNLDFDTGSADLWVFSSETPKSQINGQAVYNPSKSTTAKKLSGYSWSITYGDGSSSKGDVYTDIVRVGGLSVPGQAVECAQTVSDAFTADSDLDGLLGLSFSTINTVSPRPQKTLFDTAKSNLAAPLFTADLQYKSPGTYNFGYIDTSAFLGSITYSTVDPSDGFWTFTSSGYQVGTASFKSASIQGIADTGTTLLLLPNSIVTAYYKTVSGAKYDSNQGGYAFPCTSKAPDFTFGVGKARITIPGVYMNFAPTTEGGKTCFGGLQSSSDIGINIFGDIALKAAFVVFNSGTKQLGWASKAM